HDPKIARVAETSLVPIRSGAYTQYYSPLSPGARFPLFRSIHDPFHQSFLPNPYPSLPGLAERSEASSAGAERAVERLEPRLRRNLNQSSARSVWPCYATASDPNK
ncbi:hypothetical protein BD310DRAFT_154017, partial [Dichomitus squalens]